MRRIDVLRIEKSTLEDCIVQIPNGWDDIASDAVERVYEINERVRLYRIEKYQGVLRIIVRDARKIKESLIKKITPVLGRAEIQSMKTCEYCGEDGVYKEELDLIICDACASKMKKNTEQTNANVYDFDDKVYLVDTYYKYAKRLREIGVDYYSLDFDGGCQNGN